MTGDASRRGLGIAGFALGSWRHSSASNHSAYGVFFAIRRL